MSGELVEDIAIGLAVATVLGISARLWHLLVSELDGRERERAEVEREIARRKVRSLWYQRNEERLRRALELDDLVEINAALAESNCVAPGGCISQYRTRTIPRAPWSK